VNASDTRDPIAGPGRLQRRQRLGNVAQSAGRAVANEVGDIDVDVDVTRNRSGASEGNKAN
jgi:hypothetical protein